MNESSAYKHLTVILAALLTTIVIAIIVLVLLLTSTNPEQPADTDLPLVTTTASLPSGTSAPPSTETTAPTTDGTNPPTTTAGIGETTVQPPVTTTTPVTQAPPVTPVGPVSGSAYGDKLGSLELYAEWTTTAYDAATGNCTLSLNVYCDSYSISIGPRFENYLVINDQRVEFRTEKVSVPTNDFKARTLLYSTEYEVQKDSPGERLDVHIEFGWHYQGSYSGEHAEWLTLITDFVV